MALSQEQLRQFQDEGWLFLPETFSPEEVAVLREESEAIYRENRAEVWRENTAVIFCEVSVRCRSVNLASPAATKLSPSSVLPDKR